MAAGCRTAGVNGGKLSGAAYSQPGPGLTQTGVGLLEIEIAGHGPVDEAGEHRIVEVGPPLRQFRWIRRFGGQAGGQLGMPVLAGLVGGGVKIRPHRGAGRDGQQAEQNRRGQSATI